MNEKVNDVAAYQQTFMILMHILLLHYHQTRQLPGWKPPPQKDKIPAPLQQQSADRLYRGMSSLVTDGGTKIKQIPSRSIVVSAKHRVYSNSYTSSGGAAGYVYANVGSYSSFALDGPSQSMFENSNIPSSNPPTNNVGIALRMESNTHGIPSLLNNELSSIATAPRDANGRTQINNVFASDDNASLQRRRTSSIPQQGGANPAPLRQQVYSFEEKQANQSIDLGNKPQMNKVPSARSKW